MNQQQYEYEVMSEQWMIECNQTLPGENLTEFVICDDGTLRIVQFDEENKQHRIKLSLRQCMFLAEFMTYHIEFIDNPEIIEH